MPVVARVEDPLRHVPIWTLPRTDVQIGNPQWSGTGLANLPIFAFGESNYDEVPLIEVNAGFCCVLAGGTIIPAQLCSGYLVSNLVRKVFKVITPDLESTRTNEIIILGVKEPHQVFVTQSVPPQLPKVDFDFHIGMSRTSLHKL
jgi:hypothetical protein